MSTAKTYRKGIVSKGELVFDRDLNPLQTKKSSKSISLSTWIKNTLPKTLDRANAQAKHDLIDSVQNHSTRFPHIGSSQFPGQPYAQSWYANGYQAPELASNEGMRDLSILEGNGYSRLTHTLTIDKQNIWNHSKMTCRKQWI